MKKTLLILAAASTIHFNTLAQSLSPVAIPAAGGYFTGGGNSLSWTLGETFHTTLQSGGLMLTQGEQQPEIRLRILNLKMFIEGYYTGLGMMDNFGSGGCLFVNGLSASVLDADSVTVSAMDAVTKALVGNAKGILQTDGSVSVIFSEPVALGSSYYLKVNHRNTIETWSASPLVFTSDMLYDFSVAQTQAFGSNMVDIGTVYGDSPTWAFFSGDISDPGFGVGYQDGIVESQDYADMENAVYNILSGYFVEDITGDGIVESADYALMENAVYNIVSTQIP
jgi:hypothetical protein